MVKIMPNPLTPADLDRWQRLCEAATSGPWGHNLNGLIAVLVPSDPEWGLTITQIPAYNGATIDKANGDFIAESRSALPRLIAGYRELLERNVELEAGLREGGFMP